MSDHRSDARFRAANMSIKGLSSVGVADQGREARIRMLSSVGRVGVDLFDR